MESSFSPTENILDTYNSMQSDFPHEEVKEGAI